MNGRELGEVPALLKFVRKEALMMEGRPMIKSRHTRLLGLAAAVVAMIGTAGVIGAPAASATAFYCASSATIVARTGTGYVAWDGYETRGVLTKFTGKTLTRGAHFYELHGLS